MLMLMVGTAPVEGEPNVMIGSESFPTDSVVVRIAAMTLLTMTTTSLVLTEGFKVVKKDEKRTVHCK